MYSTHKADRRMLYQLLIQQNEDENPENLQKRVLSAN